MKFNLNETTTPESSNLPPEINKSKNHLQILILITLPQQTPAFHQSNEFVKVQMHFPQYTWLPHRWSLAQNKKNFFFSTLNFIKRSRTKRNNKI